MIDQDFLDEGVPLVLLNGGGGLEVPVPVAGGCGVDLSSTQPPDAAVLACLLDSTVTIGEDVPDEARGLLAGIPIPPLFRASSWLCRHRPLVFSNGTTEVGGMRMLHLPHFGIVFPDYD